MKRATIKIEVLEDSSGNVLCNNNVEGEIWALMLGLARTITDVETKVSEENRADYRARILALLNSLR